LAAEPVRYEDTRSGVSLGLAVTAVVHLLLRQ
jgi:hypothetical protein